MVEVKPSVELSHERQEADRCKVPENPQLARDLVGVAETTVVTSEIKCNAKVAFFDDDFEKSVSLFTKAIISGPATKEAAELYSDRAKVLIKMKKYRDAVSDCNTAIQFDKSCCKAYLQKGIAYMKVKRYYSAKEVLEVCLGLGYSDSARCSKLIKSCDDYIKGAEYNEFEHKNKSISNRLFIIYDERMCQHRPSSKHDQENPNRIREIIARLKQKDLLRRCGVSDEASPVERKYALEVHPEEYIKFIEMLPLKVQDLEAYYKYIPDTPLGRKEFVSSAGTPQAVFLAAGAVVEACRQVAIGNYQSSFAVVRPPGHHAMPSRASGFCFFNNIAIGARYLQREHNMNRIMVIDIDVHHGDGTQEIFYGDNSVLFCSVHRKGIFPKQNKKNHELIGEGKGKGYNVNINLKHALNDGDLLAVFDYVFLPLAQKFNPDLVLISAGFDAAIGDLLGKSKVTPCCFGELICRAKTISHGKLVLALEGGYCLESLAESCAECVQELLSDKSTQIVKCKYEDAHEDTWTVINQVCSVLGEYWPHLKQMAPHEDEPPGP